jgi:hypothetical protein
VRSQGYDDTDFWRRARVLPAGTLLQLGTDRTIRKCQIPVLASGVLLMSERSQARAGIEDQYGVCSGHPTRIIVPLRHGPGCRAYCWSECQISDLIGALCVRISSKERHTSLPQTSGDFLISMVGENHLQASRIRLLRDASS